MQRACWGLIIGWLSALPALGAAPASLSADQLYDRGVQAYFAGRVSEADALLSQSLAGRRDDPRVYYFRGLARLRLGRADEARQDMHSGAVLESQSLGRYAVGSSLQRV